MKKLDLAKLKFADVFGGFEHEDAGLIPEKALREWIQGFTMDAGHILVGVLTSTAVGWLVWAEMSSRRNTTRENARKSGQPKAGCEGKCNDGQY